MTATAPRRRPRMPHSSLTSEEPFHDHHHPPRRPDRQRRRRAAVHQLLPPGRLHRRTWPAPTSASRARRRRTRSRRSSPTRKMCAEGQRPICQDTGIVNVFLKIGMDVRFEGFAGSHRGRRQRRRAPRLPPPRQHAARLDRRRPAVRAQEHQGQHAGRGPHGAGAGRHGRRARSPPRAAAARTRRKFVMMNPSDSAGRLGAQDGADDGRRLVPAGHAGHRHRRHRREGDAAGQAER